MIADVKESNRMTIRLHGFWHNLTPL